jgi:DNA-binding IclR family transcriptional regulator
VTREGVLERVTQIMDSFVEAPGPLGLEDVTRATGLPKSTVFRMLRKLHRLGWIHHDERGYAPGPRITRHDVNAEHDQIRMAAAVALNELQLATEAVVHLSVIDGPVIHYLDKIGGAHAATIPSRVGGRVMATEAVGGLAMLAAMRPEDVDDLVDRQHRWHPDQLAALHRDLNTVRRNRGIAVADGLRLYGGISSLAAPVPGPQGPVAAITVARRGHLSTASAAPLLLNAVRATGRALQLLRSA